MYNGWGYEDQDLQYRAHHKKIKIDRSIWDSRKICSRMYQDTIEYIPKKMYIASRTTKILLDNKWDNTTYDDIENEISLDGLTTLKNIDNYIENVAVNNNIIKLYINVKKVMVDLNIQVEVELDDGAPPPPCCRRRRRQHGRRHRHPNDTYS